MRVTALAVKSTAAGPVLAIFRVAQNPPRSFAAFFFPLVPLPFWFCESVGRPCKHISRPGIGYFVICFCHGMAWCGAWGGVSKGNIGLGGGGGNASGFLDRNGGFRGRAPLRRRWEMREGGRRPCLGSLLRSLPSKPDPRRKAWMPATKTRVTAARSFMSPLIGFPEAPAWNPAARSPHGNWGSKGEIRSNKISDKLWFVYCLHNNFKGYIMCKELG